MTADILEGRRQDLTQTALQEDVWSSWKEKGCKEHTFWSRLAACSTAQDGLPAVLKLIKQLPIEDGQKEVKTSIRTGRSAKEEKAVLEALTLIAKSVPDLEQH